MSLEEVILRYGSCPDALGAGDKVLFEGADDFVGPTINLGEVVATWAVSEDATATALVMGIRTYLPNGRQQRFRGKPRLSFPVAHLACPIEERLLAHALRWEQKAADARDWIEEMRGKTCAGTTLTLLPVPSGEDPRAESTTKILPFVRALGGLK